MAKKKTPKTPKAETPEARPGNCFDEIRKQIPEEVPNAIIRQFLTDVEKIKAGSKDTPEFRNKTMEYLNRRREILKQHKQQIVQMRQKRAAAMKAYNEEGVEGLKALIGGGTSTKTGTKIGVDQKQLAKRHEWGSFLAGALDKMGLTTVFRGGELETEVADILFDMAQREGSTEIKSGPAWEMAKVIRGLQNRMLDDLRAAGSSVGEALGYVTKQAHDRAKIAATNIDQWRADIKERLDIERTLEVTGGEDIDVVLGDIYADITEGRNRGNEIDFIAYTEKRELYLNNKTRKLQFKSGSDFVEYNKLYGKGTLADYILQSIASNARTYGLVDTFGADPERNFKALMSEIDDADKKKKTEKLDAGATPEDADPGLMHTAGKASVRHMFSRVVGSSDVVESAWAATAGEAIRITHSLMHLGSASLSSLLPDMNNSAFLLNSATGGNILTSYAKSLQSYIKSIPSGARRQTAHMLSMYSDEYHEALMQQAGIDGDVRNYQVGKLSEAAKFFFKWTGLQGHTEAARIGMARSFAMFLADAVSADSMGARAELNLKSYGITEADFETLRGAVGEMRKGEMAVIPALIKDTKLRMKVISFYENNARLATLTPGARERFDLGTKPGTVLGEFIRGVRQFKTTPITSITLVKHIVQSNPDNAGKAFKHAMKTRSGIQTLAGFMTGATIAGYMTDYLKAIAQGKEPQDPTSLAALRDAFVKGGGAAIYGDLIFGQYQHENRAVSAVFGPTVGTLMDTMSATGKIFWSDRPGDKKKGQMQLAKMTQKAIPAVASGFYPPAAIANTFYFKTAFDHLVMKDVMETISPGYLKRQQARLDKKERGE